MHFNKHDLNNMFSVKLMTGLFSMIIVKADSRTSVTGAGLSLEALKIKLFATLSCSMFNFPNKQKFIERLAVILVH